MNLSPDVAGTGPRASGSEAREATVLRASSPRLTACTTLACWILGMGSTTTYALKATGCDGPAQGNCVCILWIGDLQSWMELRCPIGEDYVTENPPDDGYPNGGNGSMGGTGVALPPPSQLPGNPLKTLQIAKLNTSRPVAITKMRRQRASDPSLPPGTTLATTCSALFEGSPLGREGADLIQNYVVFRDGTGVKAPDGTVPCNADTRAWTTSGFHDPVVYLCDSFATTNSTEAAYYLIHETLHVAGQMEDRDSAFGPDEPPNTAQIQAVVRDACANPQVIE